MIVSRRCDVPMARRKRLFPCDHRCRQCVACIEKDDMGNESHAVRDEQKDQDMKLLQRNMEVMHGYDRAKHRSGDV